MKASLRALLSGLIDYAGLFPPARLPLAEAVANYVRYREGEDAWMLGRVVVPTAPLEAQPAVPWKGIPEGARLDCSAIIGGSALEADLAAVKSSPVRIEALEGKISSGGANYEGVVWEIGQLGSALRPTGLPLFLEPPALEK